MKILALSDSHNSPKFSAFLSLTENADMIIHCGDGERDVQDLLDVAECPVYFVRGNCDFNGPLTRLIEAENKRILVLHGNMHNVKYSFEGLRQAQKQNNADIVLFGHSHKPSIDFIDGCWFINPGSLTRPRENFKPSYAIIEINQGEIKSRLVEFK